MIRRVLLVIGMLLFLAACGAGAADVTAPIEDSPPPGDDAGEQRTDPGTDEGADPGTDEAGSEEGASDDGGSDASSEGGTSEATAYFVRAGETDLWVEPETHDLDEPTVAVARAAMELLVSGGTHDPDLTTEAPDGTEVLDVNVRDGVLIVDLSEEVRSHRAGSAQEAAFAQQLAHTAAQFDGVDAVRLWVEGEPVDELWGHLDWSQPVEPDPFALSPITVTSHRWGEEVPAGAVTFAGEATVFEATFDLRLYGPDGEVAAEDFVTADAGAPERGRWSATYELDRAGTWRLEATERDPSDGEGRPPFATALEVEVGG